MFGPSVLLKLAFSFIHLKKSESAYLRKQMCVIIKKTEVRIFRVLFKFSSTPGRKGVKIGQLM